jgi:hypothetical protein
VSAKRRVSDRKGAVARRFEMDGRPTTPPERAAPVRETVTSGAPQGVDRAVVARRCRSLPSAAPRNVARFVMPWSAITAPRVVPHLEPAQALVDQQGRRSTSSLGLRRTRPSQRSRWRSSALRLRMRRVKRDARAAHQLRSALGAPFESIPAAGPLRSLTRRASQLRSLPPTPASRNARCGTSIQRSHTAPARAPRSSERAAHTSRCRASRARRLRRTRWPRVRCAGSTRVGHAKRPRASGDRRSGREAPTWCESSPIHIASGASP